MSSDDYLDDGEFDSVFLAELDAIEAAHSNLAPSPQLGQPTLSASSVVPTSLKPTQSSSTILSTPSKSANKNALPTRPSEASKPLPTSIIDVDADDSYDDVFDDIDPAELERLDKDVEDAYRRGSSRSRLDAPSSSGATHQLTLFGDALLASVTRLQRPVRQAHPSKPHRSPRKPFGQKLKKTKKWDHTAFAKSGWKLGKNTKGKEKTDVEDVCEEMDENGSAEEFEQFPAPRSTSKPQEFTDVINIKRKIEFSGELALFRPPPHFKLAPDMLAVQTWIFPTNQPKRDYQFNIIREALFENTLVAVPTGLGKTFIAGVVMLNYYRWFPDGKVIFVAPTKPLVAQQIEACHKTCGIPGGDAVELTGQNTKVNRAKAWMEKRVFYMTPQTLMNDLKTENCDPTDIILLVIDEAHKATGDYAYAQVVRYLMATNSHFRILALTATPGSKPEAVQAIVDSLHISHIELRDENSIDLRAYMQPKEISTHIIKMSEDVSKIRDMLVKVMDKTANRLRSAGLLPNYNPIMLHTYRCSALMRQYSQDGTSKKNPWLFSSLKKLGALARAMAYLLECSVVICHRTLQELIADETAKKASDTFRSEPLFQDLIKELERQHNTGFALHPKMEMLQSLVVDYFAQAAADAQEASAHAGQVPDEEVQSDNGNTKMMVFTNFRASVDEIIAVLKKHNPLIRATPFIGQGADKSGKRGIAQKEQLEVIQKFKDGVYNVLVSTSIGEEGLDIGEVDMIICYDAQKTPIRMLQRVGRTGRKRAGKVAVLLSENREEANWQKAKYDYESVQTTIVRGETLELFGDVDRLLPENVKPKCLEMRMPIEEYVRETKPAKSQNLLKGIKRKRNADVDRNIPEGACRGFISSSNLIAKGVSKKRKVSPKEYHPDDVVDDDDDRVIQAGLQGILRSGRDSPDKRKGKISAKKQTMKVGTSTSRRKKPVPGKSPKQSEMTLTQFSRALEDDTDDIEIEKGVDLSSPGRPLAHSVCPKSRHPFSSDVVAAAHSSSGRSIRITKPESPHSWLLNSDTDDEAVEDVLLSPTSVKSLRGDCSPPKTPKDSHDFRGSPLSHVPKEKIRTTQDVLPPPSLPSCGMSSGASSGLSFAVCPPAIRRKRKLVEHSSPLPPLESPIAVQISSPAPSPPCASAHREQRHRKRIKRDQAKIWFDLDANVSGDDVPDGSSDHDGAENEFDRRFVQELAASQASPSYDQTAAYYNSLFTQVSRRRGGPNFLTKPVRRGAFGTGRQSPRIFVSSSPEKDEAPDQYSLDSFVVEDDDDIILQDYDRSSGL